MADADHTAPAHPSVNALLSFNVFPAHHERVPMTLDDVLLGLQAVSEVLTQCWTNCHSSHRDEDGVDVEPPRLALHTAMGLSCALEVLRERERSLCRTASEESLI